MQSSATSCRIMYLYKISIFGGLVAIFLVGSESDFGAYDSFAVLTKMDSL